MIIGVPKEIKEAEFRVSVTPEGVLSLVEAGHTVVVQKSAGSGSGFDDTLYTDAGATLLESIEAVYAQAEMIVKVKEPINAEYGLLKERQLLFTYLHLAADRELTELLLEKKITAFAYETLKEGRRLPLLEPMSEVAGKMASLMGAVHLGRYQGGSGRLLGGVVGVENNHVLVLGGGVAGVNAARVAAGMGADVTILDINSERLHHLDEVLPANITMRLSSTATIRALLPLADIVVGTVLLPGKAAPKLISKAMLSLMKKGSVLVDVSIDQGGCFETSHPTTHTEPTFEVEGIVHYCVANMPGAYPRTSTLALTNATLSYVLKLANEGYQNCFKNSVPMQGALNCYAGLLTNEAVAQAHGLTYTQVDSLE